MSDFYGVYAHCRDSAWRCLIDFDVRELPVKVVAIARRAGIRVVKDSDVGELRQDEYGASIKCADSWTIVYDDSLPAEESRFVIAHELGHIFLGHDCKYSGDATIIDERKLRSETQADMFAERLLAPAFALHELEITDADGIRGLCKLPPGAAKRRARRMELLEERGAFYASPLEKRLYSRFYPWLIEFGEGKWVR